MSSGCEWRDGLQLLRVAVNVLNKQSWTNDKRWSSRWSGGVNMGLITPHHKKAYCYETIYRDLDLDGFFG
jgi:hypothetical protein